LLTGHLNEIDATHQSAFMKALRYPSVLLPGLICWALLSVLCVDSYSQPGAQGKLLKQSFPAPSIQGNRGGEEANRSVTIYLPPDYDVDSQRYPVIYFLHGFGANDKRTIAETKFNDLLDIAIRNGIIRPVILVIPSSHTLYRGSFYTNSSLTGNWADYIGKDLVQYIDRKFRTIANRNSRGLTGHSMGGNGALKIGMLYADVFGSVYSMSPGVLNWGEEISLSSPAFKILDSAKNKTTASHDFYTLLMTSLARTYSPNEQKPPFYGDLPVTYRNDSMVVNTDIVKLWEANFPYNMIEDHLAQLKSLRALKIDWGRNDEFDHIPITCLQFSKKLEAYGVKHVAEEYNGNHGDRMSGMEGRIYTEMFPFFQAHLHFEAPQETKAKKVKK
jgi:S-formylglutathione hydrolase FrmB